MRVDYVLLKAFASFRICLPFLWATGEQQINTSCVFYIVNNYEHEFESHHQRHHEENRESESVSESQGICSDFSEKSGNLRC
jgi:hypothetical protein